MGIPVSLADNSHFNRIATAFQKAVNHIHRNKGYKPEMLADGPVRELITATCDTLTEPLHNIGLRQEVPPELTAAIDENTFYFSGFKTHHELVEASRLLKGDDGNFKPFEQFRRDVEVIDSTYNRNYLQAEYNFAAAASQMAVKWKEWEQDGDDYDLQYRTAGDDRVREEHAALDGITLPPSDPFWNSYLPPNGWNCRCTTVQVRKGKYPQSDPEEAAARGAACTARPKQQIFRFNPGKQQKIFPPKHPYFPKGCGNCQYKKLSYDPNNPNCQACKAIGKCISTFRSEEMKVRVQTEYRKWMNETLPETKVGKFKAYRFETNFDGVDAILNKKSYNEIANKGKNDEKYIERLTIAKKIHLNAEKFSYLKGQDEIGRDHPDAIFKCFQGEIDGYTVRIKLKCNQDGNILWALELK